MFAEVSTQTIKEWYARWTGLGLSKSALARSSNISVSTLSKWENGDTRPFGHTWSRLTNAVLQAEQDAASLEAEDAALRHETRLNGGRKKRPADREVRAA